MDSIIINGEMIAGIVAFVLVTAIVLFVVLRRRRRYTALSPSGELPPEGGTLGVGLMRTISRGGSPQITVGTEVPSGRIILEPTGLGLKAFMVEEQFPYSALGKVSSGRSGLSRMLILEPADPAYNTWVLFMSGRNADAVVRYLRDHGVDVDEA